MRTRKTIQHERRGGVLPLPKGKNGFAGGYRENENAHRAGGVEPRPYGMTGGAAGRADVVIGPYRVRTIPH